MEFFIRNHAFAKSMGILRASKSKSFLFAMPQNTTSRTSPNRTDAHTARHRKSVRQH